MVKDEKITKEKYFKYLRHFTVSEWLLLGIKAGLEISTLQTFSTKSELINHINAHKPSYFTDLTQPYYFKLKEENSKEKLTIITDEPADVSSFREKTNQRWVLTDNQIREIIAKSADELQEVDVDVATLRQAEPALSEDSGPQYSAATEVQNTTETPESKSLLSGIYKQKIRYESNMDITHFLSQVETYSYANGVSKDSNMIAIAVAALNQTVEGSMAYGLLSDLDYTDWLTFKTRVSKILGHGPEFYQHKFNTFQRGSMRLGLALSQLTQAFRKGWRITTDFTAREEDMIKTQFIRSLNGSLKLLLKSEANKHSLESILDRAIELEACFEEEPSTVNAVQSDSQAPDKLTDVLSFLQKQHREMLELQKETKHALSNLSLKNSSSKPKRTGKFKVLSGLCKHYVQNNPCPNTNCRYKHHGSVTDAQRAIFK